jgi:protein-disulfide isomerase
MLATAVSIGLLHLEFTTCRTPGEGGKEPAVEAAVVDLPGIDGSSLTARERSEWSSYVGELLAPCPDQPVSVAQCVKEARACKPCAPAARFLMTQVRRGKTRTQVEAAYRTRFDPKQQKRIETGAAPAKGAADAAVVIVEWADFECPACGLAAPMLDRIVKQYPAHVRLVFRHFPLGKHPNAETLARAAVAADRQGKFWELHRRFFAAQDRTLDRSAIVTMAEEAGLDVKRFAADMDSEATADAVGVDRKAAEALEIAGTPMLWVNGRHFDLELFEVPEDLHEWIQLEVELKTGQRPKPLEVAAEAAASASAAR